MQGILPCFETAANRRSFNMHRKCPHGELAQNSQHAVNSHHLSMLTSLWKPLQNQSMGSEGRYNDTGGRSWGQQCVRGVSDTGGEEKPMQIFAEKVAYQAFCSLLWVREGLQLVPQPGALWGSRVMFSAAFHDRAVASRRCDSFRLVEKENKQDGDLLPCPLPWSRLGSPGPSPHQSTNHLTPNR